MRAGAFEEGVVSAAAGPAGAPSTLASLGGRLRALVLLAGSVRPGELGRAIQRSLLDLPLDEGRTVLSMWHEAAESLAEAAGLSSLPVRISVDRTTPPPTLDGAGERVKMQVDLDPADFRGTGGILHDLCTQHGYGADDLVLVAHAAQILVQPLAVLAAELASAHAAVSLIGHQDGTPGGLFLVKCSALSVAKSVGFLDFKEQLLPRLAATGRQNVRVLLRERATARPIRTLDGYISGLRTFHRLKNGSEGVDPWSIEDWFPSFALSETGSAVDASATIHDSVVLRGGKVERGAVVVRSVIGPGGVVRAGETVTDRVLGGNGRKGA